MKRKELEKIYSLERKKFEQNNQNILNKRLQLLQKPKIQQEEKEKRVQKLLSKVSVKAERDPDRLLQPTLGFQIKSTSKKDVTESIKTQFQAPILPKRYSFDLFKNLIFIPRHIPLWRRNV